MSDIHEIYQQVIFEHSKRPRNFRVCESANGVLEGFNPLCGDRFTVYVTEKQGRVEDICFKGAGCAISMASASLMTEAVKGKTLQEIQTLINEFQRLMTQGNGSEEIDSSLGKLRILGGVVEFPSRVKCATLAWHTLKGALEGRSGWVSTQ